MAKRVLKISPPVPRRMGGKSADDDSSVFYLKFRSESDRDQVSSLKYQRPNLNGDHPYLGIQTWNP